MTYFVIILKVICLLHMQKSVNTKIVEGRLPNVSLIADFINTYVKPYITSLNLPRRNISHVGFRTGIETPVENVIREKINELKYFLHDYDNNSKNNESDEKLTLHGSEETTIIELAPNAKVQKEIGRNRKENKSDIFKADIQVYKKIRQKISKALKREPISNKTAQLLTKTFDGLIAKLIGSQCTWKSGDHAEKTFRFRKDDEDMSLKMHNITKAEWEHFKHQYAKLTQNRYVNETLALFNKMQGFFSRIIDKTMTMSKKYKVKCQLLELNKEKKPQKKTKENYNILRESNDVDDCSDFKICSNELSIFITDFYNSLNDTAVSAFRNYAAMYARDVTTDASFEKESVVALINNISNTVERKVNKIFAKETKNIKLDTNKSKERNIKILIHYINSTTGHVKRHIKKHLERYLKSLRARLLLNVKKDIDVNLSVDLGNLARDFISRICTVFVTCNGKYLSRRGLTALQTWGNLHVKDGKSVYVRVQLTFDDELKNTLVRNRKPLKNSFTGKQDLRFNIQNKYQNVSITRTTQDVTKKRPNMINEKKKTKLGLFKDGSSTLELLRYK